MAGIKLSQFKSALRDVARPNRFFAGFSGAGATVGGWTDDMTYSCKSVSLPSRTIGNVELNWQGMKVKLAGDPTFEDITLTFLNEPGWSVKNFFETWLEFIANMASNNRSVHADYKAQLELTHVGITEADILAVYVLDGVLPISMDAIELNMESNDTPEEFSITLAYDTFYRKDQSGISTTLE